MQLASAAAGTDKKSCGGRLTFRRLQLFQLGCRAGGVISANPAG